MAHELLIRDLVDERMRAARASLAAAAAPSPQLSEALADLGAPQAVRPARPQCRSMHNDYPGKNS